MRPGEYWGEPRDTPSLQRLEQLRVLAMYEFEPPISSQELVAALRVCNDSTEKAYEHLQDTRRRQQRSIAIPSSAPATSASNMATQEREKRRMHQSSVDDNAMPSKRRKDRNVVVIDTEEKEEETETQQDSEELPTAADWTRAQQILLQTVEDRVAARQPLRNPEWLKQVWATLQVPEVLELTMQLNLTVDALARWVKLVESQDAESIKSRETNLIVKVAASLPPLKAENEEASACSPQDEVLSKLDEEVAALALAESQTPEVSAYARSTTAKKTIECVSKACKAYMDRLGWFTQSGNTSTKDTAETEKALEMLSQMLASLAEEGSGKVKAADRALLEAKQEKEIRSQRILDFVQERHQELVASGETDASATLQSVVEVWKRDDVEVQALWKSRSDAEQRIAKTARELKVANHALTFYQNLTILFRKVRERREEALKTSSKCLEDSRTRSEARATAALEDYIPKLTDALFKYYEFHSIQQNKAKEELQEQEKALAAHNEYFGDSAPIKKGDIERRIREFIGVTQSSKQSIMEIAEGQQQLWEEKQAVLPERVRLVLIREFKALWLQLSGPMRDVMKKFVSTIEEAAGGIVAVELPKQPPQQPAAPMFITASVIDEQVVPAFTLPSFTNSYMEAVTPYRTAISAIVAPNEVKSCAHSPRAENEYGDVPTAQSGKTQEANDWANASPACTDETRGASSPPQTPDLQKPRYEFDVGNILYSKITVGENCTQFVRGVVLKQLDNGTYLMQYDNGDKFSVGESFLFTQEMMEQNLKAGGVAAPGQDTEMEDAEEAQHKSSEGRCAIMLIYSNKSFIVNLDRPRRPMSSRFSEESAVGDAWQDKFEQLQNELALAQYESRKWKEKYLVERRRRQKTARDLLDLVVRTERHPNGTSNPTGASIRDRTSSLFSSPDHTANLLSPTLSSFDFDDDSSEEDSDDSEDQAPGTPPPLEEATRHESEVVAESEDEKPETLCTSDRTEQFSPSLALELRDRQSLMYHLNSDSGIPARASRSSTTGSALEAFGSSSQRLMDSKNGVDSDHSQQQHLMYRIMHAKPSSCNLWHARAHPNKLQYVARSIMFSMHLKKEHIFERFFVTGMALSETERQHQPSGLAGYWKPKLLYSFPDRKNEPPDESVADFCFPRGVPLTMCTPDQAASVIGVAVSKWFTEIEPLQKHIKQAPGSTGYTFRLTGAKGEVLYGFCVAIMREVTGADMPVASGATPKSPRSNWTPNWFGGNASPSSKRSRMTMTSKIAPVCYCITSKFPFYRFHFALLRFIIESEIEQHKFSSEKLDERGREDEHFEIILRPLLDLVVEFTVSHEENPRTRDQQTDLEASTQNLASIATKLLVSPVERRVVLSEDASVSGSKSNDSQKSTETRRRPSRLRKSLSTDDLGSYNFANELIVDKPVVKSIGSSQPKEYGRVKAGDVLEAVDSIATASMSFEQTMSLLEKGNRPMRLRFRKSSFPDEISSKTTKRPKHRRCLSPASVDILHRARRIKMNDPGHWSTARFPTFDFSYQFPKRHSDRWSVGVVLRFLTPDKVVEIMAYLLLEKQVVIMSDSPTKVSAVCTALLLLLAPFQWQSTYIPLLPSGLLDFLHSPVPFLVGCHSLDDTSEWPDVCFYSIDRDRIAVPIVTRHLGPKSIPNGVELCRLLRKAKERFCALYPTGKPWYELTDEQDTIITLTMQESEIFLRDLGFDISSQDLAASISGGQSFYDRLQEEVAKEVRNSVYEDYLDEFTQTQLFCQYYESLLQPEVQKTQK